MQNDHTMKRIFVQMVSYRDPECHHTLADMFDKADYPERISVGLCWQYDPVEDAAMVAVPYPRPEQVKVVQFHARDAEGAGWARCEAQKLWAGEEYILQVQAHMRFEQSWDETLIDLLENLPTHKVVLTAWLPGYVPPDKKQDLLGMFPIATVNRLGGDDDAQMVHLIKRMVPQSEVSAPFLTCSWVGNFMFARAEVLREVPFDPHIYFWGEELNYSARLWTHGYDIYHLASVVLYHYWDRKAVKDGGVYRNHSTLENQRSLARNMHLLGLRTSKQAKVIKDIGNYALGNVRTIADYFAFTGVNLRKKTITHHARLGHFSPSGKPKIFVSIASFRDPETQATVADLFARAAHPDRVTVGICHQLHPTEDADCMFTPVRKEQVRMNIVDCRESKGANWARAEAQKLHAGEDYILQIDSHMRFAPGWDAMLMDMLASCPSENAVISAYLANYTPPDMRDESPGHVLRMCVRHVGDAEDTQIVHLTGMFIPLDSAQGQIYPSPFVIANFMFARAEIWQRVPLDPHIYFYGDEISMSARLWTHGIDVFQPDAVVAYHYWARNDQIGKRPYRRPASPQAAKTRERIQHLLGIKKTGNNPVLTELERYGLGSVRTLSDFWTQCGVDVATRHVSEAAKKGQWSEMSTSPVTGKAGKKPRIFVQIASYRDPDCQNTVKDLFDKATHPERITVGICWQFIKEEDGICFQVPSPYPDQMRIIDIDAREGKGVCWARSLTQSLWQGEEFTLQVDSHMRFEPGWDETLLKMWDQCESPKAVLTCYPPGFTPPDTFHRGWFFGMSAKEFDDRGIFKMVGKPAYVPGQGPEKPMEGAFASACMLFGPASIIKDVPYDPYLYFFGEEITMAARLWTHGYDIFYPNAIVMFHDWDRGKRPTHFVDHAQTWWDMNLLSLGRVRHIMGTEITTKPEMLAELDKYGLGPVRTLQQYEVFSGVDFVAKQFTEAAENGRVNPAGLTAATTATATTTVTTTATATDKPAVDNARIFVRIASYRDRECQWTVKDLFEKATHPDRISVGISWQFDEKDDAHCFEVTTRTDQVSIVPNDWRDSEGVCWARAQTEMLWNGEEYTLQIDSHMRFVSGWDELMIAELAACPSPKAVLTSSPAKYTPPNNLERNPLPTVRRVLPFTAKGNLRGRGELLNVSPQTPLRGAFVAAGFVFSRSDIMREVPYDPYFAFDQEEIMYALRLFTHGWDVYSPRKQFLYHYYNDGNDPSRPSHWVDMREANPEKIRFLSARGLVRFNHFTGYKTSSDSRTLVDIEKYPLGTARSLIDFEIFAGLDFKQKIAYPRAMQCGFIPNLERYRHSPIIAEPVSDAIVPPPPREPYDVGDIMPYFLADSTAGKALPMEKQAGRPGLLFFLSYSDVEGNTSFFRSLAAALEKLGHKDHSTLFVMDATVDQLTQFKEQSKLPFMFWADPEKAIARSLGAPAGAGGYLLNSNLQIKKRYAGLAPAKLAEAAVTDLGELLEENARKQKKNTVIGESAPVLVLPEIFPPEFCDELLEAFKNGPTHPGHLGSDKKYNAKLKVREDYIVPAELRAKIDLKLSRSLFPEIEKIFGFKISARENYQIGLYKGDDNGFFSFHRDNFAPEMGYRRIAMTLVLSDDYEGGGLRFPEYGDQIYRPARGSAIAFSCGTLHEACKVTKGERFVLIGFFHGEQEEAFRQSVAASKQEPLLLEEFTPSQQDVSALEMSRNFYAKWKEEQKQQAKIITAPNPVIVTPSNAVFTPGPAFAVGRERHQPTKVHESRSGVIFDDFLPPKLYEIMRNYCMTTEYEHINTKGKISRAWHLHDGFPLRSTMNSFYYSNPATIPQPKPSYIYPTNTETDLFMEYMAEFQPQVEFYTGKPKEEWNHFTVTSWLYPQGTGLNMHDDGSGVYTGAYAFFLNKTWRPHWGGLLVLMDDAANVGVHAYRNTVNQAEYHRQKWLHANNTDELLLEHGLGRCIFPKGNRMVFIANDAYHMITKVNETAGDNVRVSLAGFFDRTK